MPAGLFLVTAPLLHAFGDRLTVGDFRFKTVNGNLRPVLQPFHRNAQMHFAVALQDCFAGLLFVDD